MDATKVSQVSQINCGSFGPNQFTDLLMSNLVFSKIGDMFKDSFTLNPTNILKLIFLMSVNELRGSFGDLIKAIIGKLKETPGALYSLVNYLLRIRKHWMSSRSQRLQGPVESKTEEKPLKQMNITVDSNFLIALYNYLVKNADCSYQRTLQGINLKNAKEHLFKEGIVGISIPMGKEVLTISNTIQLETNKYTQEIVSIGVEQLARLPPTEVKSYLDLLSSEQRRKIIQVKKKYLETYGSTKDVLVHLKMGYDYSSLTQYFSEHSIVKLLLTRYPNLDPDETLIEIILITVIVYVSGLMTDIRDNLRKTGRMFYDPYTKYADPCIDSSDIHVYGFGGIDTFRHEIEVYAGGNLDPLFKPLLNISDRPLCDNQLQVYIDTTRNVNDSIQHFITEIYKYSKKVNDKVKIFYLVLESQVKSSEVSNPEYTQWEQKLRLFFPELCSGEKGSEPAPAQKKDLLEKMKADPKVFADLVIPPKMITKETIEKKIVSKQLNEIDKDIDTLYLRKRDKDLLVSCLSQFRDKKDVIRSLGLPNKLNILLYGEPGTGKSTGIQAVATYLRKDIYYVNLQHAETNEDLQMIFEYVNKNVANGGIVVIEDIDAMTKVVLKRISEEKTSCYDQKSKLTLDYFLNVLQGTLTMDDSIFIVTTNHIKHLDPAFYRDGRFDVKIELKFCDIYQMNAIYRRILNRDIPPSLMKRIPEDKFSPASLIFHVKNFIFVPDTPDEEILAPFLEPQ